MTKDEIAQLMQDTSGMIWGDEAHFQRFAKHLIDIEREECAKLCEQWDASHPYVLADAIRARSTT